MAVRSVLWERTAAFLFSGPSENDDQQHLELLLAEYGVGMPRGHDDGLALVQLMGDAVDGHAADAVQTGDEGVAAGLVGADL